MHSYNNKKYNHNTMHIFITYYNCFLCFISFFAMSSHLLGILGYNKSVSNR